MAISELIYIDSTGFHYPDYPTILAFYQSAYRAIYGADVYLEADSQDGEWLVGAIRVLEGHGATVYVDKKDPTLPPYTNKETAASLKNRIHQSRKFMLLASNNSKDSRWVPWELGIADEHKGLGRVAVFPAVDSKDETAWTSWEYLGLYDRVVWGDLEGETGKVWMVKDGRENTAVTLSTWLART